ncbi:T9SS-dependent M36 family metallopeptidase [Flavobacterium sp.]|uniref:T9SS-dependent M36 family metallopeptidase n=1 Tax=Flavobacterium sp. TaxID=239 RepID=UPI002B4B2F76|nr:T9SS-dependent M36 family metallopeptidase [Flavobacterium sp.]HLP64290.1 T9SS-dependent M36 family metallopeptidase [Flavobacterium sp.]
MKKTYFFIALLFPLLSIGQNEKEKIQSYLNSHLSELNLTQQDVSDWTIKSKTSSKSTKITNYHIQQRCNGIAVFNALSNVWMKENEVINIGNRFIKNAQQKTNTSVSQLSVLEALSSAKNQLQINSTHDFRIVQAINNHTFIISNEPKAEPIKAQLVYQKQNNQLVLAWDFFIDVPNQNHMWSARINASNGQILEHNDLIISCNFGEIDHQKCSEFHFNKIGFKQNATSIVETQSGSYRVLPFTTESPNHGPRELVVNPHNASASPFGWHDTDGVTGAEFTTTRGNNVNAFGDLDDSDDPELGLSPDGGPTLTFDYPYLGINTPAIEYLDAATTNLFYMNNIMHDVFYQYGFDEENGNFQMTNYGDLGQGDDYVLAQSQDGGGINNANFGTPPDGGNGRMQMYLWTREAGANLITINSPEIAAGGYTAFDNGFVFGHVDLPNPPASLNADLVLVDDGEGDSADGCSPLINPAEVGGKIAVIRRGLCGVVDKILFAQDAGAIAVIMVNNSPGNFFLGGFGNELITIPVISVKKDVGDYLISQIENATLNASLSEPFSDFVNVDGDFDNLVIAHEYGHGISNRLTGGPDDTFCLFNQDQMGEGWSDWFGLMLQMKATDNGSERRGIGTFVINQPTDDDGIRTYPYSTDMNINSLTFEDSNTLARPHGVGSVWASMLWDLSWAYVDKYGFDPNVYNGNGGNNRVLQLVIDGLKLQPCEPSFVDGRDALIAADQATTGGQDFCMIWEVFARRGLGLNASSGNNDDSTDQVEDFTVPAPGPNCTLKVDYFQNDVVSVYPNPTSDDVTIKINNYTGSLEIQLFDLNGRMILEKTIDSFSMEEQLSVKGLSSGVYLLKLNGENISSTKKLIVN